MRYTLCLLLLVLLAADSDAQRRRYCAPQEIYHSLFQTIPGRSKIPNYVRDMNYKLIQVNKVQPGMPLYIPLTEGKAIFLKPEEYRYNDSEEKYHPVRVFPSGFAEVRYNLFEKHDPDVAVYRWGKPLPHDGGTIAVLKNSGICGMLTHEGLSYWVMTIEETGESLVMDGIRRPWFKKK